MIAEENLSIQDIQPEISFSTEELIEKILSLMKDTIPNFKSYIVSALFKKRNLNEDNYTQIFIEQAQIKIRKCDYPFNVNAQYNDIYYLSKGTPDFYFYPNEQNISTASIFSVESKRLPLPTNARKKEYVIGDNENGGIERFKIEKHGKGLNECGLLGIIQENTPHKWKTQINEWIIDLSLKNNSWNKDEILNFQEEYNDYSYLISNAHRHSNDIKLHHIWINISTSK